MRQAWLDAMESAFGPTVNRASILSVLDAARQAVADRSSRLAKLNRHMLATAPCDPETWAAAAIRERLVLSRIAARKRGVFEIGKTFVEAP